MNTATTAVIVVIAVAWILYRQLQARPVKDTMFKLPAILLILGLVQTVQYVSHGGALGAGHVVAAILGLIVAVALAYPRARTTRVFPGPDGRYLRQGTPATIGLWIAAIAAHVAIDIAVPLLMGDHEGSGFTTATVMAYVGVTLLAQSWFLKERIASHRATVSAPPVHAA